MSHSSILAERLSAQLLSHTLAGTVLDVVRRLLAIQAQDPRGARLAIRTRSVGLTAAQVDHELTVERSIVVTTLNRGTLHLVRTDDYWWLHELTTPQLVQASARRLDQEQVSPDAADRGVQVITKALSNGPGTRDQLRERIAAAGIRTEGQAFAHILLLATIRGLIVRGPMVGGEQAFVLVRDWLGKPPKSPSREVALGELARRYLAGHGPASAEDLARWAGITLGNARRGLSQISDHLVDRADGLADTNNRSRHAALPPPRLIGAFDPCLLGWVSREPILGSHQGIVTSNGVFRPFAMVDGKAVATWSLARGEVTMSPFARIKRAQRAELDTDAAAVLEFLGAGAGKVPRRTGVVADATT